MDISLLRQDMQHLWERVGESEQCLGSMEDALQISARTNACTNRRIRHTASSLQQKQDDLENHLRLNNLRFVGLPEGEEGNNPATFLEDLLINTYGRKAFSQ